MRSGPNIYNSMRGLILLILLFTAACGTTAPPVADAGSTSTPAPTPTIAGTATPTPLPTLTPIPTPVPGTLYVDAGTVLAEISPLVYGTNHGPWAVVPVDLQEAADTAGITFLRFPGGNWGDQNDLTHRQIDQFIALAERMGAEPSISVRLLGGTAEQAADLVRYTNLENGYGVRYWSIGNEPSLYDDYDTERHNREWRTFATAMRAVDASILLIGPDIHQYTGNPTTDARDPQGRYWVHEFLAANGDLVDIVAIHRYPFPRSLAGPATTVDDLRANSCEWDTIIPDLRAEIQRTTGRDLPVAVTEVNSHWNAAVGGEATPDSFYNSLWWGDVLGRLIRQDVDVVAHFSLQSPISYGGWGLLERYKVRPTYYVYQIFQRFGDRLVYASVDDPDLSIYAGLHSDAGALTLILINLGRESKTTPLVVDNSERTVLEVWLYDADHSVEQVAEATVLNGQTLTLPAESILLIVMQ